MKADLFNRALQNMQELSLEESEMISGGESLWYWISYGVGALIRGSNNGYQTAGQRAYNSAFS